MKFRDTPIGKTLSPQHLTYIEDVYSSKSKNTLDERKSAYDIDEKPIKDAITYYLSYFTYNNEFDVLITKEIFQRELTEIIREPVTSTNEDQRLKMMDLKGKANNTLNQLLEEIPKLRNTIYGEKDGSKEILKALSPEERLKQKVKL